jgi:hypothetical protein
MSRRTLEDVARVTSGTVASLAPCHHCRGGRDAVERRADLKMLSNEGLGSEALTTLLTAPCPFCDGTRRICAACDGMGYVDNDDEDVACVVCHGGRS